MGGKKKGGAVRTKGNTRPSNSGRSAAKLAESGASGFIGFSTWQGEPSYIPATQGNEELDATVDPDFRLVMRKMSKRDIITKLKAIQEFTSLCKEKDQGAVRSILPFWPRVFNKLSMDHERRIREAMFQALDAVMMSVQKHMAPYLRSIMGCWVLGQCDPYAPAASAAVSAFQAAFPPAKQSEALIFCKNEIMALVDDNLLHQNAASMSEAEFLSEEEMKEKYLRTVSSTMCAWKLFLNSLPKEEHCKLEETYNKILTNDTFWKYHKHQSHMIRGSWFSLVSTLSQVIPLQTSSTQKLVPIIFNNLDDPNPLVSPFVWEAATSAVSFIEDVWQFINVCKTLIPKLKNVLRKGFNGNASTICPCLLTLLKRIPLEIIKEEQYFYKELLLDMRQGMALEKVMCSQSELNSIIKCFLECLKYMIQQLIVLNVHEAEILLIEQLVPVVQKSLEDPKAKQMSSPLNVLLCHFLMFLYCTNEEDIGEKLRTLHKTLWECFGQVCIRIMEQENINSSAIDQIIELFLILYNPERKGKNKKSGVHFVDYNPDASNPFPSKDHKNSEHKEEIKQWTARYISDRCNPLRSQLQKILLLALDGTIKSKSLIHLKCLASLSIAYSDPDLFSCFLAHTINAEEAEKYKDSAFAFFEIHTKSWILDSKITITSEKEFGDIFGNLTLASYFSTRHLELKQSILNTICKIEKPILIEAMLHMVIPRVETDEVLLLWLKGEELSTALVSIARKLCTIIKNDETIGSAEIDGIWRLLTYVLSSECLLSESCLGLMLDAFRIALPKPGSADLRSAKQLEPILHFVTDLAKQIFDNFKDCWQIPTTEELLVTLFLLTCNPPCNLSANTLNKIQECWMNGVKALFTSNGLSHLENGFLSKSLKAMSKLIVSNKFSNNNSVLTASFDLLKYIKEIIRSSSEVVQNENTLEYLKWLLPSKECWNELREHLGNQWMLKTLKEEILTTIDFSTLQEPLLQSKLNISVLLAAEFTCNIFQKLIMSEVFSNSEKEILSTPIFFYHLKEILFAISFCKMVKDVLPDDNFSWKLRGKKIEENFLSILSNLSRSSSEEFLHEIFSLSCTKGNMWSVALHCLYDLYTDPSLFTILEKEVDKIMFDENIEKIHTLQVVRTVPFSSVRVQELLALLESCEENWDLNTVIRFLAVATKLASCNDVGETETHEALLRILNIIMSWRDIKNEFFLFSSNLTSIDKTVIHFNYEVQRFVMHLIPRFSSHLSREEWDFILCGLYSWLQSCFEMTEWSSLHCMFFIRSSCLLLRCISDIIVNAVSEEMNHSNLVTEWNEFFSDGIYSILLPSAVGIAAKDIEQESIYMKTEVLNALMLALETIPGVCLENHKLSLPCTDDLDDRDNHHIPPHLQILLHQFSPLLLSSVRSVQISSYKIFIKIIPILKNYEEKLERIEEKEQNVRQLPLAFVNILTETTKIVNSFVAEMATNGQSSVQPDSRTFHYTMGYLLAWNVVMELFSAASSELRSEYASYLQESGLMHDLLANLFFIISENTAAIECYNLSIESSSKVSPQTLFSVKPKLNTIDDSSFIELLHHACYVYFLSVKKLPVLVRQWWNNQDKRVSGLVDKITSKYVTPLLCADEFQSVQNSEKKFENMMVRARLSAKEVVATYIIDEVSMELIIKLSANHPLGPVTVECGRRVGVGNTQWRNWMLQLNTFLIHQNGSLLDGLTLWKQNVDKKFEGIEECYICYYILHGSNCQLPRLMCRTCKKKFHSACLYKWFNTSNQSTCPLCRNIF